MVRAQTYPDHIDVSVNLGHINRENVRGLLGGDPRNLGLRDGTPLQNPFTYADFSDYAESWRVTPEASLLCNDGKVQPGMPTQPFYVSDLTGAERERLRRICTERGVRAGPLLDDCMLDVSMFNNNSAADPFRSAPGPIQDIKPTFP
jgi:hypothetical protein